ncbi:family 43 glycosylhydrolase [Streptomyces sp. Da 82-17]|uniref:glycoside hydrolase family 43 protein n=1 Tax=Streptomyces sp. Da 82-17 TaxID=3377116 RepID=UPI0038D4B1DA
MPPNDSVPPTRRALLRGGLALGAAAAVPGLAPGAHAADAPAARRAAAYRNPLIEQRADPHIHRQPADGHYYFTGTVPEYDRIVLRRSRTLGGLSDAPEQVIWRAHSTGDMAAHIWAPELHRIDGVWYVYFAAAPADDVWKIRMWVLANPSPDPFRGTWTEKGRIATAWDTFSLDATTFTLPQALNSVRAGETPTGSRYLAWAQHEPGMDNNTGLFLSRMANPWTLTGPQVRLSTPEFDWECVGFKVNEGAAFLRRNGKVFLTYSASATDSNYCMGLLTADADADLLDPASWAKSPEPVFRSSAGNGQFGPGHNSFTVAEDGRTDVLVYHARQYEHIEGDPLHDPNRHTRLQPFTWRADGTPDFGVPVPDGAGR